MRRFWVFIRRSHLFVTFLTGLGSLAVGVVTGAAWLDAVTNRAISDTFDRVAAGLPPEQRKTLEPLIAIFKSLSKDAVGGAPSSAAIEKTAKDVSKLAPSLAEFMGGNGPRIDLRRSASTLICGDADVITYMGIASNGDFSMRYNATSFSVAQGYAITLQSEKRGYIRMVPMKGDKENVTIMITCPER